MLARLKLEGGFRSPGMEFLVIVLILALWHIRHWKIGNDGERLVELGRE
jgi:hypothetical protein